MESVKEKEQGAVITQLTLTLTVLLLATLTISEGSKTGALELPFIADSVYYYIQKNSLFFEKNFLVSIALVFMIFLAMQIPAKPNVKATKGRANIYIATGLAAYAGILVLKLPSANLYIYTFIALEIIMVSFFVMGGITFNSIVYVPMKDMFNEYNEQFPQNEEHLENDKSVSYIHQYKYKNEWRTGEIPVVAPDRAVLLVGAQGSGKSFAVIIPAIYQQLEKGFSMSVYDFAYPDLSVSTFNGLIAALKANKYTFGKDENGDPIMPDFHCLTFEDLRRSNRCNPFQKDYMQTIEECNTMAKTLLYNLNKEWIKEENFWAKSAINLLTSYLWFLRIIERANPTHPVLSNVCSLPHAIQLLVSDFNEVINAMANEPELDTYSNMFVQGLKNEAGSQIAGQIASAQASLAPLASPNVTWVMTGNDMELEINNPKMPRIITIGNYTLKDAVYGAAISVYKSVIMKRSYKFRERNFALFLDELPTVFVMGLDKYITTIRKHRGCVWIGLQDFEQLVQNFGKQQADVITNTAGTTIVGMVNGQTAERVSKMFGKTEQGNYSASFNKETSVSYSTQAKELLPASKIMSLSQGHFVGKVADNIEYPVKQKLFSGHLVVPTIEPTVKELPLLYNITEDEMQNKVIENAKKVRRDIKEVMDYLRSTYTY